MIINYKCKIDSIDFFHVESSISIYIFTHYFQLMLIHVYASSEEFSLIQEHSKLNMVHHKASVSDWI